MPNEQKNKSLFEQFIVAAFGWSWFEIAAEALKLARKLWRGLADEGMYDVLEYETTLELKERRGAKARFSKRQKVKYQQNNIIAYQDQAWGDGEILLNYRCSPGKEVDRYRPGKKTFILISLRETKQKGDTDEFYIEWEIKDGFMRSKEQWGTEISHRTKYLKNRIIFPKSRPPIQAWAIEQLSNKKFSLENDTTQLPDGRWLVQWETKRPRLHGSYVITWEW